MKSIQNFIKTCQEHEKVKKKANKVEKVQNL
jgi:hypothetical protein